MTTQHSSAQAAFDYALHFYAQLQPHDLGRLEDVYAHNAAFKDPFNTVQGVGEIRRIFAHMFANLHDPRFVVDAQALQSSAQGAQGFVTWRFTFALRKGAPAYCIRGASHWVLEETELVGWRITLHRDYWDAAEELYAKLPVLGWFMRKLQKRLSSAQFVEPRLLIASSPHPNYG